MVGACIGVPYTSQCDCRLEEQGKTEKYYEQYAEQSFVSRVIPWRMCRHRSRGIFPSCMFQFIHDMHCRTVVAKTVLVKVDGKSTVEELCKSETSKLES